MKKPLFAAIDAGTSSVKCIALDPSAPSKVIVIGNIATRVSRPATGLAEIKPREVLDATVRLLEKLLRHAVATGCEVRSVGLTGHIGGAICVDRRGNALEPCAIWQDQRCAKETGEFFDLPAERITAFLGTPVPKGVCWPAPKIRWLARNRPGVLKRTWRILQIKDYLFYHLTGRPCSEPRTFLGFANTTTGDFTREAIRWCGIRAELLPELRQPSEVFPMHDSWQARFRFCRSPLPRIGIGTADMTAAFLGCALGRHEGALLANTSEILCATIPAGSRRPTGAGLIRAPYRHDLDLVYGSTTNGGSCIDWFQKVMGPVDLNRITTEAARIAPGSDGLIFLPYLTGERAPIWDGRATGSFLGLRAAHTKAHLYRAILEGCAFSKRHVLEAAGIGRFGGMTHVKICGGTSQNRLWNQIRASVLNLPLWVAECQETSALGALFLAAETIDNSWIGGYRKQARHSVVPPRAEWVDIYRKIHQKYLSLSQQLRTL